MCIFFFQENSSASADGSPSRQFEDQEKLFLQQSERVTESWNKIPSHVKMLKQ
jgi:hypothetical protein